MRVYLIGFMGAGKTWMGKQVGLVSGFPFLDLDAYIEQQEGQSISVLFEQKGEDYFRSIEQKCLQELTTINSNLVLSCGGGTPCFFDNIDFMKKNGTVIWLDPPVAVLVERLKLELHTRPLLNTVSPSDLEGYVQMKLSMRSPFYEQAHYRIKAAIAEPMHLLKLIQHG